MQVNDVMCCVCAYVLLLGSLHGYGSDVQALAGAVGIQQVSRSVFKFVARLRGRVRAIFSTYALFIVHGNVDSKFN